MITVVTHAQRLLQAPRKCIQDGDPLMFCVRQVFNPDVALLLAFNCIECGVFVQYRYAILRWLICARTPLGAVNKESYKADWVFLQFHTQALFTARASESAPRTP
jgi:hypothetical protein